MRHIIYDENIITETDGTRVKVIVDVAIDNNRISVTGAVYEAAKGRRFRKNPDRYGQVTDDLRRAFPWLVPLIDLHLSDVRTGEPLYALDNGWFWLHDDEADGPLITSTSRRRAARYLRTTPGMLEGVRTKNDLEALINTTLAPAWKKQMDAALALYDLSTDHKPQINKDLESLQIIYTDDKGCLYTQPLSDLTEVGTLVDPDEDTDLTIVGYTIA